MATLSCGVFLMASFVHPFSKWMIWQYVLRNQEKLTAYAQNVIDEQPLNPKYYNGWRVYYYSENMVEFCTSSFGLTPSTTYKGFYYSADDLPHGFQNVPVDFHETENGWEWTELVGDNIQYTERITLNWYWYEAKF